MELAEILRALEAMPADKQDAIKRETFSSTKKLRFIPNMGPQTDGYRSKADIMLYGGGAGGGKSALAIGLAIQEHQRSIIFRREGSQTDGLIAETKLLLGDDASYNGQHFEFVWENKSIKFAGMKEADDWRKFAGRERDLIVFDEAGEFLQEQVQSAIGWNRGPLGQRCRIVLASNPPRDADGLWMLDWFAPWLAPGFVDKALPGELRWAYLDDVRTVWVDGPEPVEVDGKTYFPHSRTFIPARLADNPYRNTPEYRAKLMMTPEPLRSQLLYGDFLAGQGDKDWQAIPTAWIREAQARWRSSPPPNIPMSAMGVDVSGGGSDGNVLAIRYDSWFAPLIEISGARTPLGTDIAGIIIANRKDQAKIIIDCGGGYGGVAYTTLKNNGVDVFPYKGAEGSNRRTKDQLLRYANKRSEAYWSFREALDPSQAGGSLIMLPDDPILVADLTALEYKVQGGKKGSVLSITPKEQIVQQLGRSTDRGDAVVMAYFQGPKNVMTSVEWGREQRTGSYQNRRPQVVLGYQQSKRLARPLH